MPFIISTGNSKMSALLMNTGNYNNLINYKSNHLLYISILKVLVHAPHFIINVIKIVLAFAQKSLSAAEQYKTLHSAFY